ncbi:MAG: homocysteine S-methyltransferase family protein [Candidatus Sumerlaeaceae bacterium]
MRNTLLDAAKLGYVLADGAMGTELLRRGLPIGACTAAWNVEKPDEVAAVHQGYVDAGSDCLVVNTFSANRLRLREFSLEARSTELNQRAVEIARGAAGDGRWLLGSIGPCSGFREPRGSISSEASLEAYTEQISALANAGVDGLLIETITDTAEMRAAVEAAHSITQTLPVLVSFCFQRRPETLDYRLIRSGESLQEVCALLSEIRVDCAGANCGAEVHMEDYAAITAVLRGAFEGPLIMRPNGGQLFACGQEVKCAEPPEIMADGVWGLVRAGASIIGGCCGTTRDHIRLFRQELDKL